MKILAQGAAKIVAFAVGLLLLLPLLAINVGSTTTAYGTRPDTWKDPGVYLSDTVEGAAIHEYPCIYQLSDGTYWAVFKWGGSTIGGNAVSVLCYKHFKYPWYSYGFYANWTAYQTDDYLEMELIPGNKTIGGGTPARFVGKAATEGNMPHICEDRYGKIWLVYQNATKVVDSILFYKISEDRGKTWHEAKPIPLGYTGRGGTPAITCTSNNTIVVAWDEGTTGNNGIMLTYTFDNGTTWATPLYACKTPVSGTHLWPDVEWVELFNETGGAYQEYLIFTFVIYTGSPAEWVAVCRLTQDLGGSWLPDPSVAAGKTIAKSGKTDTDFPYPASGIAQVCIREPNNTGAKNRTLIGMFDKKTATGYDVFFGLSPGNLTPKSGTLLPLWSSYDGTEAYGGLSAGAPGLQNVRGCPSVGPLIWDENETLYSGYLNAMLVYAQNLDSYKGGWARGGYWNNWSAYGTFGGWVKDGAGIGISNASVSVYKPGSSIPVATSKTNETGFYVVKALDWSDVGTSYEVETYAGGYAPSGRVASTIYYAVNTWQNFTLGAPGMQYKLASGWNYMCLNLANSTITNASALAQAIGGNCTHISNWTGNGFQIYDAVAKTGNFSLEHGRGYNVYVTAPTTFILTGTALGSATLTLNPGWNNIGWFNVTAKNASTLATEIKKCEAVAEWNATLIRFVMYYKSAGIGDFELRPGRGYLVYVTEGGTWTQHP